MRPSAPSFLRLVKRSELPKAKSVVLPAPALPAVQVKPPTLQEVLLQRQELAGESWPLNLRIEPFLSKAVFRGVSRTVRSRLKRITTREA